MNAPAAMSEFDFAAHLAHQAAWSEQTFGPGKRTAGVCDHIRKELAEVEADPEDTAEWIDVVILALDGAWRSGMTPEQIIAGIVAKQRKNEGRNWPDWRTADPGKAIEHDRSGESQPASADSSPAVGKAVADEWLYRYRTRIGEWSNWAIGDKRGPEWQAKVPRYEYEFRPLYTHPAPPVAPGEVSELVQKWRAEADRLDKSYGPGDMVIAANRRGCADELESALSGRGGKEGTP